MFMSISVWVLLNFRMVSCFVVNIKGEEGGGGGKEEGKGVGRKEEERGRMEWGIFT